MGGEMNENIPLGLIGISHKTAPVEIRDKVTLNVEEQESALKELKDAYDIEGCFVLSTCNRTEIYCSGENLDNELSEIRKWLDKFKTCHHFSDSEVAYQLQGIDAIRHFFRVISSLDSQIVGESQITGQVKDGYELAHGLEITDTVLNKLFNYGMQTKKKVHSNTYLSDGTVSVSFAGVELARKIFSDLKGKEILLVGAGKTAELAAYHFLEDGVERINVANRTLGNAQELARKFNGAAYTLDQLGSALETADIVISATSSDEYVITHELLAPVCKKRYHQPIFLIDLAIPRDMDPGIGTIDNVYLYNLDDLQEIVEANLEQRQKEIPKAQRIIDDFVEEFQKWISTYAMTSIVGSLKKRLDILRRNEILRLKKQLPENGYADEIDNLTESIINKIVRQHVKSLKKSSGDPDKYQQHVDLIRSLLEIDED
ncbi:glutamyl-tRNA reductase [Bacteroidota bacterium]